MFEKDEILWCVSKDKEKPPTNPITITIEADEGYTFKETTKPCTIEVQKGSAWFSIKEKAEDKIELKDGYEKTGWKLGGKDGGYIEDTHVFNANANVYATSKKKGEPDRPKLTITVKADEGVEVGSPNSFTADSGSKWASIKTQAEEKAKPKENFEIITWHLNNADGTLIKDETEFKGNTTVFAKSKKQKITITVECDGGVEIGSPDNFIVDSGSKWCDIKRQAEGKTNAKENFEIESWHLNNADGTVINDETEFKRNTTVFAVSKRKVVQYKVEHVQENIENDEYTVKETEGKEGEAGKNTLAEAKQYEGFSCQGLTQKAIKADGSTVVQIKYKRNRVSLILDLQGGTTTTVLEDDGNGKKLLKGKFEARVEVKGLEKENYGFEKWEPALPEKFPATSPNKTCTAKWKKVIVRIKITGDERVKVAGPQYIDIPVSSNKTIGNIRSEIEAKVSLSDGWSAEDYCFYDWRMDGEKGEEMQNSTQITEDITVYARTNYKRFKLSGTTLEGYEGEKPRGRIFIPKTVEIIKEEAFKECDGLTAVDLTGCTEIEKIEGKTDYSGGAFYKCTSLESIDLSACAKLTKIGHSTFSGCSKLKSVNLSGCTEITGIGSCAFEKCRSLETIDLSACTKLTKIDHSTFSGCSKLKSVNLSGCTEIEEIGGAFYECISLESIDLSACHKLTKIGWSIFEGCSKLKSVNLTGCSELKEIGGDAFSGCSKLKSVNLSGCSELKEIGREAFKNCTSLESIDLSPCHKLTKIGWSIFEGCSKLKSVNLSGCGEIKEIEGENWYDYDGAFFECSTLESIDLSPCTKLTKIGEGTFLGCTKAVVKLSASITVIGELAFGKYGGSCCKNVLVPNEEIRQLVIKSGYPEIRIEMY